MTTATPTLRRRLNFIQSCHGNVAMIAALMAVPLVAMSGGALDYMAAGNGELQLRQTLDAAVFAAAKPAAATLSERQSIAQRYMSDNLPPSLTSSEWQVTVSMEEDVLSGVAQVDVDTSFLNVIGIQSLPVSVRSQVTRSNPRSVEMVMVMDTTNSMRSISGGWDQAIEQINAVIDTVLDEEAPSGSQMISILPFTDRVSIGDDRTTWLAGSPPSSWDGCVEPREETIGSSNYALDDDSYRSEPFTASIPGVTGGLATRSGGYPHCGPRVTGPTSDAEALQSALDDLDAQGTGRFDEAIAWGWRMLSPKWRGDWGPPNYPANTGDSEKVIAIFTDGMSNAYHFETIPFPDASSLDNEMTPAAGLLLENLCQRIIADDIKIFVFYINGSDVARPYFQRCTNDATRFFEVGGVTELSEALESLVGLGTLRLTY